MREYPILSADEAAAMIQNGDTIAVGGFTTAGSVKVITKSLAERAQAIHAREEPFAVRVLSGASTDTAVDDVLANAEAISYRLPYQTSIPLRQSINARKVEFLDMHLSSMMPLLKCGALGVIDYAIFEAAAVYRDGSILLTSAVGPAPTFARLAKHILIELNTYHPDDLEGLHDIYELDLPPRTREIPIYRPSDRIGATLMRVNPAKIAGIVHTNVPDHGMAMTPADEISQKIGENIAQLLVDEMRAGRMGESFFPIQAGVGNVSNALLSALYSSPSIPQFCMYSEIVQDTVIDGIDADRIRFASSAGLSVSPPVLQRIYSDLPRYLKKLTLRPQEITNHPEVIRRLGVIGINTALEVDIWGNVNSTHVCGTHLMNGIGGSGDFTRNSFISIFATPSTAKGGSISAIVPHCSHIDHTEHDTQFIVTEYGVADLRGKGPMQRARAIIDRCAHPSYRDQLNEYLDMQKTGRIAVQLRNAFAFHEKYQLHANIGKKSLTVDGGKTHSHPRKK
ncbi:MAG: succinate CoA transferase [Puniceicoccales bacterium]|jgi:acetyl-CoA hydrolase|nr:succinate CoA transferase [Puniceicoccales bacterium]